LQRLLRLTEISLDTDYSSFETEYLPFDLRPRAVQKLRIKFSAQLGSRKFIDQASQPRMVSTGLSDQLA
jgi:hypothetical protein